MLVVAKPSGDKYLTAIRYDTPCVNLVWLRDALLCNKESIDEGIRSDKYKVTSHGYKTQFLKEVLYIPQYIFIVYWASVFYHVSQLNGAELCSVPRR